MRKIKKVTIFFFQPEQVSIPKARQYKFQKMEKWLNCKSETRRIYLNGIHLL